MAAQLPRRAATESLKAVPTGPQVPGRQRRWSLALLAVLITVGSALAFVVLYQNAGDKKPVLAMARTVPAGQVIAADDLTVVNVSADPGLDPVPSSDRDSVVGKTAGSDLVKGSLLTKAQLTEGQGLEPGKAIAPLTLARSQLPIDDLRVGDHVQVVNIPAKEPNGSIDATKITVLATATVYGVEDLENNEGQVRISLLLDEKVASHVAVGNAVDSIRIVLVPAP